MSPFSTQRLPTSWHVSERYKLDIFSAKVKIVNRNEAEIFKSKKEKETKGLPTSGIQSKCLSVT